MIEGCKDPCSIESRGRDWPFPVSVQELGTLNEAGRMRGSFLHQGLDLCNVTEHTPTVCRWQWRRLYKS